MTYDPESTVLTIKFDSPEQILKYMGTNTIEIKVSDTLGARTKYEL
jgi:hypothetical protein